MPGPTSERLLRWRFPARSRLTELSTTGLLSRSGSLAMLAAIRRASSSSVAWPPIAAPDHSNNAHRQSVARWRHARRSSSAATRQTTAAETARRGHSLTKRPKFIGRPADDDRTNERIEKYGDPSASNHVASSGAVDRTNKLTEKYADPSESNHAAATCNFARSGSVIVFSDRQVICVSNSCCPNPLPPRASSRVHSDF